MVNITYGLITSGLTTGDATINPSGTVSLAERACIVGAFGFLVLGPLVGGVGQVGGNGSGTTVSNLNIPSMRDFPSPPPKNLVIHLVCHIIHKNLDRSNLARASHHQTRVETDDFVLLLSFDPGYDRGTG